MKTNRSNKVQKKYVDKHHLADLILVEYKKTRLLKYDMDLYKKRCVKNIECFSSKDVFGMVVNHGNVIDDDFLQSSRTL